jgi:hypothetical protein
MWSIPQIRVRLKELVDFGFEHQADASVAAFLAAGLAGLISLALTPPNAGSEMVSLANNIAAHVTFANPFSSLATGPTAITHRQ